MISRTKRRFIAGAVCPKCALVDKLVVFKEDSKTFRECVSCGYRQEMQFSPQFKPLPTRVDAARQGMKQEMKKDRQRVLRESTKTAVVKTEVVKILGSTLTLDRKD